MNKALTMLGFAAKAGKLSFGMDAAVNAIKSGKSKLCVMACDISDKSKKEICFHAEKKSVKTIIINGIDINTVSVAVGRKCGILSVNDSKFADAFLKAYVEGGNANDR